MKTLNIQNLLKHYRTDVEYIDLDDTLHLNLKICFIQDRKSSKGWIH